MTTPSAVIAEVRQIIQDATTPYRLSDTVLTGFVNDVLKRMVVFRPDLFATLGSVSTTANAALQSLPAGGVRLVEVFQVVGGNAVTEVDRQTLDRTAPGWMTVTAGTPVNFVRHPRNPSKYFLYPRPTAGVNLLAEYVATPATYGINDNITILPDAYFPQLVDGVVWLAESIDNEHANSGRAKMFLDSFVSGLGIDMRNRAMVDREDGGVAMEDERENRRGRS